MNRPLELRYTGALTSVPPAAWDRLTRQHPFVSHGFLHALEASGSVGPGTGWRPHYVLCYAHDELVGAVAAYWKTNSYGEYIFDFAWANAIARAGRAYYPKLVVSVPFTPATGPRLLLAPKLDEPQRTEVARCLIAGVRALADETKAQSIHWLFCTQAEQALLVDAGFAGRASFQYHWQNKDYASWDDFLAGLTSRRRKQLRKERAAVAAHGLTFHWRARADIDAALLSDMTRYYQQTVDAHDGHAYLTPAFFPLVHQQCDSLRILEVSRGAERLGACLFFESPDALYGRYWGATADVPFLHFEAAYYVGIERAIAQRVPLFEAGAQGEHKLLRGFLPASTYSAHWLRAPDLFDQVTRYCHAEKHHVAQQMAELATAGPYRQGDGTVGAGGAGREDGAGGEDGANPSDAT